MTNLTDEWIERLRQSGLRLARDGTWWHEGQPVRHEGMTRAFHRWLDRLDDGRYVLRLDEHRYAYVEVEDAPILASSARISQDRVHLILSNEREEPLDPASLEKRGEDLYCLVSSGRLPCRLTRQATYALGPALQERGGVLCLQVGGQSYAIPNR